jgi:tRNA(fMet)-specific endonuclease VapC
VSAVVADTSVWIELFARRAAPMLEGALREGSVVLPPIVVAELISGARRARDRTSIQSLIEELPVHETPLDHWIRVGDLRRRLASRGVAVSTPDAHVAQCALDRGALLLSRDAIFLRIAAASELRVQPG